MVLVGVVACGGSQHPDTAEAAPTAEAEPRQPAEPAAAAPVPAAAKPAPVLSEQERLVRAEQAAYAAAKPVFDEYCEHCHTGSSKRNRKALKHFNMDSYPFTGHHAHEIGDVIRKALGVGGGKPTMPKDDKGAVVGENLELIVAWSKAYDAAHATPAEGPRHKEPKKHHDHGSGHKH